MIVTLPLALLLLALLVPIVYVGFPRLHYRRLRDSISLLLRCLIVTLLVLALAGLQTVRSADKLAVVFLLDVSDSMAPAERQAGLTFIRDSLATMSPDDQAAVVAFGAQPLVERRMSSVRELGPLRSTPPSGNTNLGRAIDLALALFPADAARRIVILSDGEQTTGDAEAAARRAAAAGVEISYVGFVRQPAPEIQLTDVSVPAVVREGQQFDLTITVDAQEAADAAISVFASGTLIHRESVALRPGTQSYTLSLRADGSGLRDFRVQVDPIGANDQFYQNNQLGAFTNLDGAPRVLLISTDEEEARHLEAALSELDVTVVRAAPNGLPTGVAALLEYKAVIMANVPATRITPTRMEALQTYVRDLGGGLVVIGGPQSYGPGGYFQTPLEETLPLDMQIRDQQRLPELTIAYVIDRSGSMSAISRSGVELIELAKEAIIRSIDFLQPTDRAGVVSFDTVGYWIADVQPVLDRRALQVQVGTLRASGGTDILAGLRLAGEALSVDPAPRKHIILLTDGGASPTGLVELSGALYEQFGVTVSVIAIGDQASFLPRMAEVGGGNYHFVDTVEAIPTIFTTETVLATRAYILEQEFTPTITALSPILSGIASAPTLLGYIATTPKETAQVILRGPAPYNDPILASWQYGLGRAVAFTSDATARWASNWVGWDDFARFWSQAVRWTITEGATNNLEARVMMDGERARLVVDARDDSGGFLNGLVLGASLVAPNQSARILPLQQVAPGRYEAEFVPDAEGAYLITTFAAGGDERLQQNSGWVMSYSAEYDLRQDRAGLERLELLAAMTNGRSLRGEPAAVFDHNLAGQMTFTPLAPLLLLLALLLLPIDIAVRRLIITQSDVQRVRAALARGRAVADSEERMGSLMEAKARARQTQEQTAASVREPTPTATVAALRERKAERAAASESLDAPRQSMRVRQKPIPRASPSVTTPPPDEDSLAGKLLQRRQGVKPDDDR